MKPRNLKLVCLLLETVGIVALFLPFSSDVSPLVVIANVQDEIARNLLPHAGPLFIAVLVWLLTLRQSFLRRLTSLEVRLIVLLSSFVLIVLTGYRGVDMMNKAPLWLILVSWWVPSLIPLGLMVWIWRARVPAEYGAPIALRCAYIPNALFCLVAFGSGFGLQSGAALVAATVALYLAEIVYLTMQGLKARPTVAP